MSGAKGPRTVIYVPSGDFPLIGQQASTGSLPIVIASDQSPIPITGSISVTPPAVQNVTGSDWTPSVLVLSGSVTGFLVGGQPVSSGNPLPISGSISVSPPAVQDVRQLQAGTTTDAVVSVGTTNVQVAAANSSRRGLFVTNCSDRRVVYLRFGTTASTLSAYAVKLVPGHTYEMQLPIFTGSIQGIADGANGSVLVQDLI